MESLTLAKSPVATPLTANRLYASGGTYTDTRTDLVWNGGNLVTATVSILPGLQYWTCPPAAVIRGWVDDMLKGHGMKRDGARIEVSGTVTKWYFHYYLKPVN